MYAFRDDATRGSARTSFRPFADDANDEPIRKILIDHQRRYPEWRVEDLYKLVHQAAMGSEHAVIDEDRARAWLVRELREMGPGPDERLIDPISPDGRIVRIHLRPFVALGLESSGLLRAFIETARGFHGAVLEVERGLEAAERLARSGELKLRAGEIIGLAGRAREAGFAAIHHSEQYTLRYRPAYRVVARALLPIDVERRVSAAQTRSG
ncbi:MAG: hypothetical protein AB1778_06285 [Candidatus Bipolaricaulota bacterium]